MRVAIIHPWLPRYRLEFFDALIRSGKEVGFDIAVFYGTVPPEWKDRGDSDALEGAVHLKTRFLPMAHSTFVWKNLAPLKQRGPWDLIVVEQAVRNLETYMLLAQRYNVAMWGHGGTYTKAVGRIQESLKFWLTRRARWFFAYTDSGARLVAKHGFPLDRVTILNNTIGTDKLKSDLLRSDERKPKREVAPYGLFLGALDESKRLPFLFDAARLAHNLNPAFRLVIAGDGPLRGYVQDEAKSAPWLAYVGRVDGLERAHLLRSARFLALPGRAGLGIIDGLLSASPIITTASAFHPPEFDYLEDGVNSIIAQNDKDHFASAMLSVFGDSILARTLAAGCERDSAIYTTDSMVARFLDGLAANREQMTVRSPGRQVA